LIFADLLAKNSQSNYVTSTLLPIIKYDLEWVLTNWQSDGCDLWEEVRSNDFFWNRAGYVYTLKWCETIFNQFGDSSFASRCSSVRSSVTATLDAHWTGTFVRESTNREKDSAVIHAFSSFEVYPLTDSKVAQTIQVLTQTFCSEYAVNQAEIKAGIPGILLGRYPGDIYAGGNPWQLLTAVLAKTFYQVASVLLESNGFLK
jgi:glucoamylase